MAAVFLWFDGGEEWVPLHVFGLATSLLALLVGRFHRLHVEVDPHAGVIRRHRTLFGIPLSSPTEWIRLSETVELHLHRGILHDLSPRPASNYALYALLADGTRRRILFTHGRHSLERERALIETAEYIATIADCTVRLAFDGESLSRAEIARILEQRHASSTPSPARLDEPKPADEGPATVRTKD